MTKKKLLLIGAGPTSSLIAYGIKSSPKLINAFDICVWEKSKGIGGRFSTSRSPTNSQSVADLGAQYLTWNGQLFSKPYFDSLIKHNLISELDTKNIPGFQNDPTKSNYVCLLGTGSIVKHFFNQAGNNMSMHFNKHVKEIIPMNHNGTIQVKAGDGTSEEFHIVVTTIPVPQLMQLENVNSIFQGNNELKIDMEKVRYTTRFALGLFYDTNEALLPQSENSALNFVSNDPIIRYWSIENKKRKSSDLCAIVIHTSVKFGAENAEQTAESMKTFLLEKVESVIEGIKNSNPTFIKCHKWRYSQVETAFPDEPGCVLIAKNVVAAGDGFTRSGFEGCIKSSMKTIELLNTLQ